MSESQSEYLKTCMLVEDPQANYQNRAALQIEGKLGRVNANWYFAGILYGILIPSAGILIASAGILIASAGILIAGIIIIDVLNIGILNSAPIRARAALQIEGKLGRKVFANCCTCQSLAG